jgi:hypothetical protein
MTISEEMMKDLQAFSLVSRTGNEIYMCSFTDGEKHYDWVFMDGYPMTYRIFTLLCLKAVFNSVSMPQEDWDAINQQMEGWNQSLKLKCKKGKRADMIMLSRIRRRFKEINDENDLKAVQAYIASFEEKFKEARANPTRLLNRPSPSSSPCPRPTAKQVSEHAPGWYPQPALPRLKTQQP